MDDAQGDRSENPRVLAGDIGGTHARLALAHHDGARIVISRSRILPVREYAGLAAALADFLRGEGVAAPSHACFAWAGPIEGQRARLTNGAWQVDAAELAHGFGIDDVALVNDFHAAASGIDALDAADLEALQPGQADPEGARLVIGAGTGLGVAYAIREARRTRIVAGEGGHVAFAPLDDEQAALWRFLRASLGRVTAEHLVSGGGIVRLYAFCCTSSGTRMHADVAGQGAAAVARLAHGEDPQAQRALDLFCSIYGAVAGDHALSCLATGGVFVAGGIAPKLAARIAEGRFMAAFADKGVHRDLVARMPVWLVRDELLGLRGAALIALARRQRKDGTRGH